MPKKPQLQVGSFIRFRYRNEWTYGKVTSPIGNYMWIGREDVPANAYIFEGVWKFDGGEHFEVRHVRKMSRLK